MVTRDHAVVTRDHAVVTRDRFACANPPRGRRRGRHTGADSSRGGADARGACDSDRERGILATLARSESRPGEHATSRRVNADEAPSPVTSAPSSETNFGLPRPFSYCTSVYVSTPFPRELVRNTWIVVAVAVYVAPTDEGVTHSYWYVRVVPLVTRKPLPVTSEA